MMLFKVGLDYSSCTKRKKEQKTGILVLVVSVNRPKCPNHKNLMDSIMDR